MRKLQNKDKVLDLINRFPSKTNRDIANETQCHEKTVAKYRKEIDLKYDSEFVRIVAGKFIKAYGRAAEYWLNQIDRLEELKVSTHIIYLKNEETGGSFEKEVELSPMDKLAIEKHQSELQAKILYLASQGEVREVINIMRMGKIPMLETNHEEENNHA